MATITINGSEYTLACNLRVAYELQGQHNHKPYSEILASVGEMPLEQQIDILYLAFKIGNPEVAKTFTREMFRCYILDNNEFNAVVLIDLIKKVIAGILGKELPESEDAVEQDAESAKN